MLNLENIDLIDNHSDQFKAFLYSFFIWTSIFAAINQKLNFKTLPRTIQNDIRNRIVSIIHGLLLFWCASLIILYEKPNFCDQNSQSMQLLMIISASYFSYDLLACQYYDLSDTSLVFHHSFCIVGLMVGITSHSGGPSSIWGMMCGEVSNFAMHMRCILRNIGLKYTKIYETFEWAYFALYIIFRAIFAPYMVIFSWPEPSIPLVVRISATGLLFQSVYFIFQQQQLFIIFQG